MEDDGAMLGEMHTGSTGATELRTRDGRGVGYRSLDESTCPAPSRE